jgi:hypothetical protein
LHILIGLFYVIKLIGLFVMFGLSTLIELPGLIRLGLSGFDMPRFALIGRIGLRTRLIRHPKRSVLGAGPNAGLRPGLRAWLRSWLGPRLTGKLVDRPRDGLATGLTGRPWTRLAGILRAESTGLRT